MKGKLANGVDSQYSSHYLGTWCIQHYYRWRAFGYQYATELIPPADLNELVRFAERQNLVSARVPSHFKRSLPDRYQQAFQCLYRKKYGGGANFCDIQATLCSTLPPPNSHENLTVAYPILYRTQHNIQFAI